MSAHTYFLRTLPRLDVSVVENRLARELLTNHPPDNLFVRQLSRPRTPLFNNIYLGLVRCSQEIGTRSIGKLIIDNSLKIACPALKPERNSLQSDYGASSLSVGENCKLKIASKGAFDA